MACSVEVVDLRAHQLFPSVAVLADEAGAFKYGNVFLHGGEAHRIPAGECRDGLLARERDREDVAARRIGQSVEDQVGLSGPKIYNHMVSEYG